MADEKAAPIIDEKLVEFGCDRLTHPESLGGARHHRVQGPRPMLATDPHPFGADLPGASNIGVDQGIGTATIGRALGDSDELLGQGRQQRQRNDTEAVDLQSQRRDFDSAGRIEITGPPYRPQHLCKS
jgi:hypothetical protein